MTITYLYDDEGRKMGQVTTLVLKTGFSGTDWVIGVLGGFIGSWIFGV